MKTKKQEHRDSVARYRLALAEGRVVRYNGGLTHRSFNTVKEAEDFLQSLFNVGLSGEIVKVDA